MRLAGRGVLVREDGVAVGGFEGRVGDVPDGLVGDDLLAGVGAVVGVLLREFVFDLALRGAE